MIGNDNAIPVRNHQELHTAAVVVVRTGLVVEEHRIAAVVVAGRTVAEVAGHIAEEGLHSLVVVERRPVSRQGLKKLILILEISNYLFFVLTIVGRVN